MQFNEIHAHSLKPNEEYKIKCKDQLFRATFNKYREYNFPEFINIKQGEFHFPPTCFTGGNNIYYQPIFQKEKIQQNMERRALLLIIRKITGDQYFEW
jgi:hypothetical protein